MPSVDPLLEVSIHVSNLFFSLSYTSNNDTCDNDII